MTRYVFYEVSIAIQLASKRPLPEDERDAAALILIRTMRRAGVTDESIGNVALQLRNGRTLADALRNSGVDSRKSSAIKAQLLCMGAPK